MKAIVFFLTLSSLQAFAQSAPSLKTLKGCDDLASLKLIQAIDAKEVEISEMGPRISQQLNIAATQTGEAKTRMCTALRAKAEQYGKANQEVSQALSSAISAANALGVSSCVKEMQQDMADSRTTAQNVQTNFNHTCSN